MASSAFVGDDLFDHLSADLMQLYRDVLLRSLLHTQERIALLSHMTSERATLLNRLAELHGGPPVLMQGGMILTNFGS